MAESRIRLSSRRIRHRESRILLRLDRVTHGPGNSCIALLQIPWLLLTIVAPTFEPKIISRPVTPIRHVETLVHPDDSIQRHDYNLNGEIDDVETRFRVIPGRVVFGAGHVPDARPESSAEREDEGGGEQDIDFGPEAAFAEFLDPGLG